MMTSEYVYAPEQAGTQPPNDFPRYGSTIKRAPKRKLIPMTQTLSEITGPSFSADWVGASAADLTGRRSGAPIGERIIVTGRILDEDGRPLRGTLVELWQANSAGRYTHENDGHNAPLDPNFPGVGHLLTDDDGTYRFLTVRPGCYPWRNETNAWRPAHIHFSVFGAGFASRLITQMYFPGDPLLPLDPVYNSIPDQDARKRLISAYDHTVTEEEFALGFRFDIVLRGRHATPLEN